MRKSTAIILGIVLFATVAGLVSGIVAWRVTETKKTRMIKKAGEEMMLAIVGAQAEAARAEIERASSMQRSIATQGSIGTHPGIPTIPDMKFMF